MGRGGTRDLAPLAGGLPNLRKLNLTENRDAYTCPLSRIRFGPV